MRRPRDRVTVSLQPQSRMNSRLNAEKQNYVPLLKQYANAPPVCRGGRLAIYSAPSFAGASMRLRVDQPLWTETIRRWADRCLSD